MDGIDPADCNATDLTVHWSGTDDGAGVAEYTIFVSENGGPATPWLAHTQELAGTFPAQPGKSYGFYSVARDLVGNVEEPPATPDLVATRMSACCSANADCDDGNPCTGAETCNAAIGACIAGAPLVCDDDGDPCTTDECVPASGCTHVRITACPAACAAECIDDDPCTTEECVAGSCERGDLTGVAGARCVCQRSPDAACADQAIPARLTKKTDAACASLELAATATKPKQRKKRLKKAANGWRGAGRLLEKPAIQGTLSPGCLGVLREAFDDAATRATRAVTTP